MSPFKHTTHLTPHSPSLPMTLEAGSNGDHHSVPPETGHVIELATQQPSIPHSLVTHGQSKLTTDTTPHPVPTSDSDSSPELPTRPHATMSTSGTASLDLPPTKLPLLHKGETTQSQLRQLEVHCTNYFSLKDIAAEKQVANVIGCFHDYRITTWLDNNATCAAAILLTFKAFMAEVCERLLPTDWECSIKQEMLS
ncbi:hypothetical protein C8R44DRAFT_864418 [Mycena epipterygia]|nr:hypothetical protein C8R44DRAFT_864418 [Mycena epipterygia]